FFLLQDACDEHVMIISLQLPSCLTADSFCFPHAAPSSHHEDRRTNKSVRLSSHERGQLARLIQKRSVIVLPLSRLPCCIPVQRSDRVRVADKPLSSADEP